jgi:hypothetical protein
MIENGRMRLNQLTENSPVLPRQRQAMEATCRVGCGCCAPT